jgi:hypothetical protein
MSVFLMVCSLLLVVVRVASREAEYGEPFRVKAAPLPASVPDGGYGGLGYSTRGFGKGYRRDAASPVQAVEALIGRVGLTASDFTLSMIPASQQGLDTMQLGSAGGKVLLKGSSGVALASALNWFMNEFCNATMDWNTYHLEVPPTLPLPPPSTPVRVRTVKWGYYMNVCTMGYSLVFTDWNYWEKQIDWAAMNGGSGSCVDSPHRKLRRQCAS